MKEELNYAIDLVEKGQVEQGLNLLLSIESNLHDEEKYYLAEKYFEWGNTERALSIVEDLHELYPDETDISLFLADLFIDSDKEDEAITVLNSISPTEQGYPQALLLLADLYQMQGLNEVSERKLQEAKKLLPNEPIIDFALGEFYFHKADYKKAYGYYEEVLKEASVLAGISIHQRLAESLSLTGSFEEALPFYEKAAEEQPDLQTLFGYGFTAMQGGFYGTAISQFQALKEMDPQYTSLYLHLAKAYEHEGMLKESLQTVKEGLSEDEFNKELYLYGGKIALKAQRPEEAEALLREAVALDPGHVEAIITLTNILLVEEKFEDVADVLNETAKYGEEDPQFDWNMAKAQYHLENYSDALNLYQTAYNSFKDNQAFLIEYAFLLMEEGDRKEAKKLFDKVLAEDPANVEIQEIVMQLEDEFSLE
ncbi:tetratricopeptide repeat protein [Metabacillus lacus]|uniref:tetratricopeptide repeat protein n=1 Tax=Metabacillus lacus TaxID=1983721 RepID=UPI001FEB7B47|nr:tetratricopeptide repeat protein [Metabacillus lacus]